MLLGLISENQKGQEFLFFCSPVTPDFEVISEDLSSFPLGNSDPAWNSLTFIHIPLEIHPSVFFHSPPPCSHPPTIHLPSMSSCSPITLGEASTFYWQLSYSHRQYSYGFSLHPLTITHASRNGSFRYLSRKKTKLSDFPLVSAGPWELWFPQMNSVQEPSLIEKTQAWSAMKEMVLVSQLNCANVLSRAGEGERKREENTKRAWDRGQTADWGK